MLFYEFFSHLIPSLFYLTIISLFKIGKFDTGDYLALWLGGLIGTYLIDIDHIIYALFLRPEKPSSLEFQKKLKEKKYFLALKVLVDTHFEHQELSFHNAIFIPIWAVFCFFILTSSGSIFASAMVMTVYLHLLKDIWDIVRLEKKYQLSFLFWQIKRDLSEKTRKIYVWFISFIFFLESIYLFF